MRVIHWAPTNYTERFLPSEALGSRTLILHIVDGRCHIVDTRLLYTEVVLL